MAPNVKARWVTIPFTHNGKTAGLRMTYGTAIALNISETKIGLGFATTNVAGHSTYRRLYPGGPAVKVDVAAKTRQVAVGPSTGRARTNKKLVIKGGGPNQTATIYYSGNMADAVAWLKANADIANGFLADGYDIYSSTGRPLTRVQYQLALTAP